MFNIGKKKTNKILKNLNTPTKDRSCWEALLEKCSRNVLSHMGSNMYPALGRGAVCHCFRNQITFTRKFTIHFVSWRLLFKSVIFYLYHGSYSVSMLLWGVGALRFPIKCAAHFLISPHKMLVMDCRQCLIRNAAQGMKEKSFNHKGFPHLLLGPAEFKASKWGGWGQTSLPSEVSATPAVTSDLQDTQLLTCRLSFSHCRCACDTCCLSKAPYSSIRAYISMVGGPRRDLQPDAVN